MKLDWIGIYTPLRLDEIKRSNALSNGYLSVYYELQVLSADSSTVNCVQGHPGLPVLASSGIENVVRLWHPRPEDGQDEPREIKVKS